MLCLFLALTAVSQELGIGAVHIKLRATGGNKTKTPGPGAQSALRALARAGIKIGRIGQPDTIPASGQSSRQGLLMHVGYDNRHEISIVPTMRVPLINAG